MKILSKLKTAALVAALSIGAMMPTANADALDDCARILRNGTYTIRYENITPPSRNAMHEKLIMIGGNDFIDPNPYTLYQPITGIATSNGESSYVETNSMMKVPDVSITSLLMPSFLKKKSDAKPKEREYEYASCKFKQNGELFIYTRITDKGKVEYVGKKKGKVEAVKIKKNFTASYSIDVGDHEMNRLLDAIMPDNNKVEGTVIYRRVNSGTLADGRYYVDLKASNPGANAIFDAIRYYFESNRLVKIEAGQYFTDKFGKVDGVRTIINVHEFNASVDNKLLKLPPELKDVTKRENDQKGAAK